MFFDPMYLLFVAPGLLLALWAQYRISTTYAAAQRLPAELSGAAAARHILDSADLRDVAIEQISGHLSDHYDPRDKVLRLSPEVYQSRTLAAVGIAAPRVRPRPARRPRITRRWCCAIWRCPWPAWEATRAYGSACWASCSTGSRC